MNSTESRETFCQAKCRRLPYSVRVNDVPHAVLPSRESVLPREDRPFRFSREQEYNIVDVLCENLDPDFLFVEFGFFLFLLCDTCRLSFRICWQGAILKIIMESDLELRNAS